LIQLVRPAEPAKLVKHRKKWTERWEKKLSEGKTRDWATSTAKRAVQAPLVEFSRKKCAFCEGTLNLTSFLEIEHYHAKTVKPLLAFQWENLFPCCGICNGSKSNLDHEGRLLKPDAENPEPLLWLDPGTGELQPHPTLGAEDAQRVSETIEAYNLKRGALCVQRIEMMNFVNRWLSRVAKGLGESDECQQEWRFITQPSTPWKFVIRHILTLHGQPALAEIDRQAFLRGI
jgi:uncharacterized protein (TIGR02646 family)